VQKLWKQLRKICELRSAWLLTQSCDRRRPGIFTANRSVENRSKKCENHFTSHSKI